MARIHIVLVLDIPVIHVELPILPDKSQPRPLRENLLFHAVHFLDYMLSRLLEVLHVLEPVLLGLLHLVDDLVLAVAVLVQQRPAADQLSHHLMRFR